MTTRTRTLLASLAVLAALTGCSASGGADASLAGPEGAYDAGGAAPADGGAAAAEELGSSADAPADGQQVVQTAHVTMTAQDPVAAARRVVTLVGRLDGRVDSRYERASGGEGDPGSASLTVRVPSAEMATLPEALGEIGEVQDYLVETENVTSAAQDLDARITATELSIERMTALLARASSSRDLIEAEGALTERQANLERLRSERARLADRVTLSTVDVEIWGPSDAPEALDDDPPTFLDGLETGWTAFTATVRGVLVVLGVLLPWLVVAALVVGPVLVWRRRRRAARPVATTAPAPTPGAVAPATAPAPGAPPADGPAADA